MEGEGIKIQTEVDMTISNLKNEIAALRFQNDTLRKELDDADKKMREMCELPESPIECAEMLINKRYKIEVQNCFSASGLIPKERYVPIYTTQELRQIAEHLLVYCNYNEADDED